MNEHGCFDNKLRLALFFEYGTNWECSMQWFHATLGRWTYLIAIAK